MPFYPPNSGNMKRLLVIALGLSFPGFAGAQEDKILQLGQQTYQSCVACHGPDGKGIKAGELTMAPALPESAFVKGDQAELLTAIILKGILKEDNKYVQAMLALEAALNDEQIAALVSYVTHEFGGKRHDVKPSQIAEWRKAYAKQTSPWRREDLASMLAAGDAPQLLSNVRYSLYSGKWEQLPNFEQLEPEKTGELKKNLISLSPAGTVKSGFGMVFDADLTIPEDGTYFFSLTSDDGSALVVDGETVVGNDGIHPAKTANMKEELLAGNHTLRLLYFDGGGQRALSLSIRGDKEFGTVYLSEEKGGKKGKSKSYDPIPLTARNPGEAIVHRAFLPDAKPRAIGIGYPGRVNAVWDADNLNIAYLYRGDFMDAAQHWNARGSGSTPTGIDRTKIAEGLPLQVLESLDEPWIPFSETKVKYERDTSDPQKEITINLKHPDYQFRGYRLDKKRFPTFTYDYKDITVTDRLDPLEEEASGFVRTIRFDGKADENLFFRVAAIGPQTLNNAVLDIGHGMKLSIEGADPVVRKTGKGNETLVPVADNSILKITYLWMDPIKE